MERREGGAPGGAGHEREVGAGIQRDFRYSFLLISSPGYYAMRRRMRWDSAELDDR